MAALFTGAPTEFFHRGADKAMPVCYNNGNDFLIKQQS